MDSEELRAIAALAFCSADSPDWAAFYRKVCRWFSKNFAVPLPVVENEMAEEYVLQHYFEDMYCTLAESTSDESHKQWTETKGRIVAMFSERPQQDDDIDDDQYWEKALEEEFKRDNPDLAKDPAKVAESGQESGQKSGQDVPIATDPGSIATESRQHKEIATPDQDGWVHAPNLEPEEVNIVADDPIPED